MEKGGKVEYNIPKDVLRQEAYLTDNLQPDEVRVLYAYRGLKRRGFGEVLFKAHKDEKTGAVTIHIDDTTRDKIVVKDRPAGGK